MSSANSANTLAILIDRNTILEETSTQSDGISTTPRQSNETQNFDSSNDIFVQDDQLANDSNESAREQVSERHSEERSSRRRANNTCFLFILCERYGIPATLPTRIIFYSIIVFYLRLGYYRIIQRFTDLFYQYNYEKELLDLWNYVPAITVDIVMFIYTPLLAALSILHLDLCFLWPSLALFYVTSPKRFINVFMFTQGYVIIYTFFETFYVLLVYYERIQEFWYWYLMFIRLCVFSFYLLALEYSYSVGFTSHMLYRWTKNRLNRRDALINRLEEHFNNNTTTSPASPTDYNVANETFIDQTQEPVSDRTLSANVISPNNYTGWATIGNYSENDNQTPNRSNRRVASNDQFRSQHESNKSDSSGRSEC